VIQLAKGAVEEVKFKGHSLCLKLTSTLHGEKYIYLSFTDRQEYDRWHRKCKKVRRQLCEVSYIIASFRHLMFYV